MRLNLLREVYGLMVRMHPALFRDRFGEEMLWIFDEERRERGARRLLWDGARSVVRQHARAESGPGLMAAGFGVIETGPGIAPRRFLEATIMASGLLAGAMVLLGQLGRPYPVAPCLPGPPPRVHRTLSAPFQGAAVSVGRSAVSTQGASEVNDAAASAVKITQRRPGFAGAPYCSEQGDGR